MDHYYYIYLTSVYCKSQTGYGLLILLYHYVTNGMKWKMETTMDITQKFTDIMTWYKWYFIIKLLFRSSSSSLGKQIRHEMTSTPNGV